MSNYTVENLIPVTTPVHGTPAIRIGDQVFPLASSGGGSGILDAALVTEYTPYRAAFTAVSSYAVSGFDGDYSAYNGTYEVTAATQYKTGMERVYKKSGEDRYLVGWIDDDMIGGPAWGFGSSSSLSTYSAVAVMSGSAPASGSWMNYDMYESMTLTLTGTDTTYPEQPLVLTGKMVTAASGGVFELASTATILTGWKYAEPSTLNALYVINGGETIGWHFSLTYDEIPAVPTGWSGSTNGGFAVTESYGYPGNEAWYVFNRDRTTSDYGWYVTTAPTTEAPQWFAIEFPEAIVPGAIYIMNEINSPENFRNAKFQGSNDGSTWTDLLTITDSPDTTGLEQLLLISTDTAYTHFRFYVTDAWGGELTIQAFTIYKRIVRG